MTVSVLPLLLQQISPYSTASYARASSTFDTSKNFPNNWNVSSSEFLIQSNYHGKTVITIFFPVPIIRASTVGGALSIVSVLHTTTELLCTYVFYS